MPRDGKVIEVDSGLNYPNGIAVQHTADGKPQKLLVANWDPLVIYSYDIIAPGVVRNKRVWGNLQGGLTKKGHMNPSLNNENQKVVLEFEFHLSPFFCNIKANVCLAC